MIESSQTALPSDLPNFLPEASVEKFGGGPVGLDTLSAAIGEDSGTIEDVYEPYLIKNGFINRTPKGRVATDLAYTHLGKVRPQTE